MSPSAAFSKVVIVNSQSALTLIHAPAYQHRASVFEGFHWSGDRLPLVRAHLKVK